MPAAGPMPIPVPVSSFPGATQQESSGRLINCYAENLGDPQQQNLGAPKDGRVWRRLPGLTQYALTGQTGYRGGLESAGTSYEVFAGEAITLDDLGNSTVLGPFPGTSQISIASNQNATSPDVVAVDPITGAFVLHSQINTASATITIGGSSFVNGDTVTLLFVNPAETLAVGNAWPVTITYTLPGSQTAASVAAGLTALINAKAAFIAANLSASAGGSNVITVSQIGVIGNQTEITFSKTGSGNETATFNPTSGFLVGGAGVAGTFTGIPTFYNGQTNLPQPNSVSFQDGYFFFTIADGAVYASGINQLSQGALSFARIEAKADVTLLRGIAYQGYMFFFTSGSIEVWSDAGNPAPGFPYNRSAILAYGLLQSSAIAGFETGFDDLLWVAQDFGVYRMTQGSLSPNMVSPPDLNRLIETQVRAGDTLRASVYIFAGKKVWVISSAAWTWQFHLDVQKWYERMSLTANGSVGQWRGIGGHPAFGKWLMGDQQSTAIVYPDDTNNYDALIQNPTTWQTTPVTMLMRIETGLVDKFPVRTRVARADFHFVRGTGQPVTSTLMNVTGAAAGTGGVVRLAVNATLGANTGDTVVVANVVGTTEANGSWVITVIDNQHLELTGSVFVNNWVSGGTVMDTQLPPGDLANPVVAVSWSDDGGLTYRPPVLRNLGPLSVIKTGRIAVKNTGLTGQIGRRWRMDISAPTYIAFLKATQSDDPTITN